MPVPIAPGDAAPPIDGVAGHGAHAVVFYKVTCPVCQMAAPKVQALADAFPGRVTPVGQDPPARLEPFAEEYGMTHLICRTFFPGMPHAQIMRELELLAREVAPAFS